MPRFLRRLPGRLLPERGHGLPIKREERVAALPQTHLHGSAIEVDVAGGHQSPIAAVMSATGKAYTRRSTQTNAQGDGSATAICSAPRGAG